MPTLFGMSIRDNIALGAGVVVSVDPMTGKRSLNRATVTEEDIVAAATTANAHAFITALPDGYDTVLGSRGALLSGGQRQRVAIARALVRRPPILLLDEATAALDSASERAVQVALARASQGRTTVVIAHRLSTVQDANIIAVLGDGGRVVERGSHAVLMQSPVGAYRHLVELQSIVKETAAQRRARKAARAAEVSAVGATDDDSTVLNGDTTDDAASSLEAPSRGSSEVERKPAVDKGVAWRAVRANAREWPLIVFGALSGLAGGASWPIMGVLVSKLLLFIADPSDEANDDANRYCLALLLLGVAMAVVNYGQMALLGVAGERLTLKLRSASFRTLLRAEMAFFDTPEHSVGALSVRLATEATKVKGLTGDAAGTLLMVVGAVGVGIILGLVGCWKVALVVLALMPAVALNGFLEVTVMSGTDAKAQAWFAKAGRIASDSVDNVRTVTTLGVQRFFLDKYNAGEFWFLRRWAVLFVSSFVRLCAGRGSSTGATSLVYSPFFSLDVVHVWPAALLPCFSFSFLL